MSRATDLRYGRRGGGWVPSAPTKEHRRPDRVREAPCPRTDCAGLVEYPLPRPTTPYEIRCDGLWPHTFTVTPLAPHTAPTKDPAR